MKQRLFASAVLCFLLLSLALLTGCREEADPSPQANELRYGHQSSSVDVTVSGDFSPDQGRWLIFQVYNDSPMPVALSMDRNFDPEDTLWVASGESGSLVRELGAFRSQYHFGVNPPSTGGLVSVSYVLTQSTVQPNP